ncbi:MAG: hypothetical protein Q8Q18_00865 [bacterium]|nr:hypothetical protein [bacterium]
MDKHTEVVGFFEKLEKAREKPLGVRKAIARTVALIVVLLISLVWLWLGAR